MRILIQGALTYHMLHRNVTDTLTQQNRILSQRIGVPSKENLPLVKYNHMLHQNVTDTLTQQNRILSQRIGSPSKENLLLVKYKRKVQEAKAVIEVPKVPAEASKNMKPFGTLVNTGLGTPPVGLTSSTSPRRTPAYFSHSVIRLLGHTWNALTKICAKQLLKSMSTSSLSSKLPQMGTSNEEAPKQVTHLDTVARQHALAHAFPCFRPQSDKLCANIGENNTILKH
ncbi:hypothetical protein Esti_002326 [Eimeria stiedai]